MENKRQNEDAPASKMASSSLGTEGHETARTLVLIIFTVTKMMRAISSESQSRGLLMFQRTLWWWGSLREQRDHKLMRILWLMKTVETESRSIKNTISPRWNHFFFFIIAQGTRMSSTDVSLSWSVTASWNHEASTMIGGIRSFVPVNDSRLTCKIVGLRQALITI